MNELFDFLARNILGILTSIHSWRPQGSFRVKRENSSYDQKKIDI